MCILISLAQREYISAGILFLLPCFIVFLQVNFMLSCRRVIFGMLIALPITLVYYILLGI